MKPEEIAANPVAFERWWQWRDPQPMIDKRIQRACVFAGLIRQTRNLLFLTDTGREFRERGIRQRQGRQL